MLACKKEWKLIILSKKSYKKDGGIFKVPNIKKIIIYKTELFE